jgi:hypothetical protein
MLVEGGIYRKAQDAGSHACSGNLSLIHVLEPGETAISAPYLEIASFVLQLTHAKSNGSVLDHVQPLELGGSERDAGLRRGADPATSRRQPNRLKESAVTRSS